MTSTQLAPRAPAMAMGTLSDPRELGNVLAASGYFSDARDAAQAVVKVLAGAELGFGPIASMTGVYIVKGRVTLSANLMAAAVKRHPKYDYRIRDLSDDKAVVQFFERGGDGKMVDAGSSDFTMAMARQAGLANGENWKKYPRNMLLWRAMSNGAKFFCPDAFAGAPVYTPDELGAEIDPESGELYDSPISAPVEVATVRVHATDAVSSGEATGSAKPDDGAEPAQAGAALQESPAPAEPGPEPEPEPGPEPDDNPDRTVSVAEAAKLAEYLATINAPETFTQMALMSYDVDDLSALTVGQAHAVMERAKARYGAKA